LYILGFPELKTNTKIIKIFFYIYVATKVLYHIFALANKEREPLIQEENVHPYISEKISL